MEIVTYLFTGALAGLMAGLLGIGGGLVIVPVLALFFASQAPASAPGIMPGTKPRTACQ